MCSSSSSSPPQTNTDLGPPSRRTARRAIGPAGRVPVPAVLTRRLPQIRLPNHHMCGARTDLVITARASIRFSRAGTRNSANLIVIPVGPGLDAALCSQRRGRILSPSCGASPAHQNNRNSALSMPRRRAILGSVRPRPKQGLVLESIMHTAIHGVSLFIQTKDPGAKPRSSPFQRCHD